MAEEKNGRKKMAIICAKGGLDDAYPPLILATTAAALDMDVAMFFTFYGLNLIHKKKMKNLKVAAIANPAPPMPVPTMLGMLPGMSNSMTRRHFTGLAEIVRSMSETIPEPQRLDLAVKLADLCARFNDRFDYIKFVAACEVEA